MAQPLTPPSTAAPAEPGPQSSHAVDSAALPPAGAATSAANYGAWLEPLLPAAAGYAWSILRNHAEAEDAVQQAALRGLEQLSRYNTDRPFRGWWFTLLHHACIDLQRRRQVVVDPQTWAANAATPTSPASLAAAEDLAAALERLDPAQAGILRLRYFAGLTYAELAAALGIPPGTVMSRLHHARVALGAQVKEDRT
ncbi:MAG: RNA polymerase sigma factor [Planctomycetota bacterium]